MAAGEDVAAGLKAEAAGGAAGLAGQGHGGLPGGAVALAHIAGQAGGGHVLPDIGAAPTAGDDVVDGERLTAVAAILTAVAIAVEDIAPGEGHLAVGHPHELA